MFTPYSKNLNEDVAKYFIKEGFTITSNAYFDIDTDTDIAKVDPEYLYETMLNMNLDFNRILEVYKRPKDAIFKN